MSTIQVDLRERSYPVYVGKGNLKELGRLCTEAGLAERVTIVTGEPLWESHGQAAEESLKKAGFKVGHALLPDGEQAKSLTQLGRLYERLAEQRHERGQAIIAVGGGTVGDVAGFAAASYLRGVPVVQVPTTLLAQVDSAIGGKTGINLNAGKNLAGAFWQPRFVLCDTDVLKTLPKRAVASGLGEVVKYGCIAEPGILKDADRDLSQMMATPPVIDPDLVARCVQIKAKVVAQDEQETNLRRILNFGHTYAHALESASGYESILHGEAVALGILVALELSIALTNFPADQSEEVYTVLKHIYPHLKYPEISFDETAAIMTVDKKVAKGKQVFVLLRSMAQPIMQEVDSHDAVKKALALAKARWQQ